MFWTRAILWKIIKVLGYLIGMVRYYPARKKKYFFVPYLTRPHIFRHTYATRCVEYGLSPNAIQKLLGHATLDMLNVYAHPSTEFLKEECKKYNFYYAKDRNDTNEKVIPIDFRKNSV